MTTNDVTGDTISNTKGNADAYAKGWDAIWGNMAVDEICLAMLRNQEYAEDVDENTRGYNERS